ncbi:toll/interleukin-1 receptor domain-containing protein [Umezawaea sp. Da 62-37]|uniref:toll/interleukin-1 receptor domain-containing protein n=1 Tax=Umezawaea sp. Da 62-37 TaxID=3075927 RepID=UPI0028F70C8E|nr:toll/interleukin-1 receptor domain-containing protein [Umezawaea sp. Da 62-37]WNV85336.1 toll/interleukin-1 receptor domain-containing protein [Umezawaea sp. Da 62-37]
MGGVFINYRNEDGAWVAALLDLDLSRRFGSKQVFRASRSVGPGDFQPQLEHRVRDASVLLAVIDREWADPVSGGRRLQDPDDWVRREIELAFEAGVEVIPVLVDTEMPSRELLPEPLRPLVVRNYTRLRRRTVDDDLARLARMVEQVAPELAFFDLVDRRPRPSRAGPPSALLDPHRALVDFQERDGVVADLETWCLTQAGPPVVLTGTGGAGKTRTAVELCERMAARGWLAGFVSPTMQPEVLRRLDTALGPALLVFDRAETRGAQLAAALSAAAHRPEDGRRVAVLALARSVGDWFEHLADAEWGATPVPYVSVMELPTPTGGHAEFFAAHRAFAAESAVSAAAAEPPAFPTALDAHEAALAEVLGSAVGDLLKLERQYWVATAPVYQLPDAHPARFAQVVAAACLFGASDDAEALATLRLLPTFADDGPDVVRRYGDWARELYPGIGALNPMASRRLTEEHVTTTMTRYPDLLDLLPAVTPEQAVRAFTGLAAPAAQHPELAARLGAAVARAPARLVPAAIVAVAATDEPDALVAAVADCAAELSTEDLDVVVGALPRRSLVLGPVALRLEERAWQVHRYEPNGDLVSRLALRFAARAAYLGVRQDDAVTAALDQVESPSPAVSAEAWAVLALLHTGDRAVEAGALAVAGFRDLGPQYHGQYATALHNQSVRLRSGGLATEAGELARRAAAIARELVARDRPTYLSLLADVLDNLAAATGDVASAREALEHRHDLARVRNDAYLAPYAGTLNTLGRLLRDDDPESAHQYLLEARSRYEALNHRHHGRFDRELTVVTDNLAALEGDTNG